MQELEKILEEIEQKIEKAEKIIVKPAHDKLDEVANDTAEAFIEAYKECRDIIRKYMENDGWIPVEKYGLPKEEGIYDLTIINGRGEYVSVRWEFLSGVHLSGQQHYVDGVHYWADNYQGNPINEFLSERVIAWRKKPEPYHLTESESDKNDNSL